MLCVYVRRQEKHSRAYSLMLCVCVVSWQARGSANKLWPVNVGVKAFHGDHLHNGIAFFDSFAATFWANYLGLGNTYGLNEQSAMMDVLKVTISHAHQPDPH